MNKLKEEGGYTLIIALLLIVLFMGMSAVFVQASLSHATQEQTVDQGNLAVSAAEMGVEKYSKEAENAFIKTYAKVNQIAVIKKQALENEVKKYPSHNTLDARCPADSRPMQDWIDCNIGIYEEDLKSTFLFEINKEINLIDNSDVQISDTLAHQLTSISPTIVNADDTIKLDLNIEGVKSSSVQGATATNISRKIKELSTELTFPQVSFFDENAMSELEVEWGSDISDVTNFFPQLLEKPLGNCPENIQSNMPPCKYIGSNLEEYLKNLSEVGVDSSFYIKVDGFGQEINTFNGYNIPILAENGVIKPNTNINSADNITLYYNGLIEFQNANKHTNGNFIVAKVINFEMNQNIVDNTLINIGTNESIKPIFKPQKITINTGSTLCVNIDGVKPDPLNLFTTIVDKNIVDPNVKANYLSVESTGKIYLFTKGTPPISNTENVKFYTDAEAFLQDCGVEIQYNVEGIEKFGLPLIMNGLEADMEMDVDYQP